jgi:hypothetical protein
MIRRTFIGSWLAALVGQAATLQTTDRYQGSMRNAKCKDGEEHCPLGHCQKPRPQWAHDSPSVIHSTFVLEDDFGRQPLHVCSMCGIVYVSITK